MTDFVIRQESLLIVSSGVVLIGGLILANLRRNAKLRLCRSVQRKEAERKKREDEELFRKFEFMRAHHVELFRSRSKKVRVEPLGYLSTDYHGSRTDADFQARYDAALQGADIVYRIKYLSKKCGNERKWSLQGNIGKVRPLHE